MTTGMIEFVADTDDFKAVKKKRMDGSEDPMEIARFFASVQDTMVRKTYDYMKGLPLEELEAIAGELCDAEKKRKGWKVKGRMSEERMNEILGKARGAGTTRRVNELVQGKAARELAKQYVMQRTLDILGFPLVFDQKLFEKYLDEKALSQ